MMEAGEHIGKIVLIVQGSGIRNQESGA
jgi:hypothetical protein